MMLTGATGESVAGIASSAPASRMRGIDGSYFAAMLGYLVFLFIAAMAFVELSRLSLWLLLLSTLSLSLVAHHVLAGLRAPLNHGRTELAH